LDKGIVVVTLVDRTSVIHALGFPFDWLFKRISIFNPKASNTPRFKQLVKDLVRIAETSPHLLADAGLKQTRNVPIHGFDQWETDALGLALIIREGQISVVPV
jgi:hypothetical protein